MPKKKAKRTATPRTVKKKAAKKTKIDSLRHNDKRKNIPTEELRDFVRDDDQNGAPVLYPRDPSLDPQLVWKGKDEQDREPLSIPTVPIYIQEKIHPQDIIESFRHDQREPEPAGDRQLELFSDFNGLPEDFDKRVDFYQHDGHWSNRMILGDSLMVMNSLAEKEGLRGKVQMVYIDPPYGIRFGSNWQVSTRNRDVKEKAADVTRQPEQVRAFRDTWKMGIHSYLPYLRDRLSLARVLLSDSGSVFVQIGDENLHLVRNILDEIFGAENFASLISFSTTTSTTGRLLPGTSDYILWYAKDVETVKYRQLYLTKAVGGSGTASYSRVQLPDGTRRTLSPAERRGQTTVPEGSRVFSTDNMTSPRVRESRSGYFPVEFGSRKFLPNRGEWKTHSDGVCRLIKANRIVAMANMIRYVRFVDDFPAYPLNNMWTDVGGAADKVYVVQTANRMIERCMLMTTDPGDLVLDPTCGSGTTAHIAECWGRRWITIDTSRVSIALARTRLMSGRFPYFLMADSPEGVKREAEAAGTVPPDSMARTMGEIRKGFVCKRVAHVQLKDIANNEEIDVIHAKWQEELDTLRERINKGAKQKLEEWELPREPESKWPKAVKDALEKWWDLRRQRQKEIDESIARHSDTELLYDQPYEDKKRVRVTGPFTVESLSPHRTISVAEKESRSESFGEGRNLKVFGPDQFGLMIIDNLRKAGVQNTKKQERLRFESVEPYAGEWIHAEGQYTESDGTPRRAAICIGPEFGTVAPELVKEAAKEAVRGVGFDVLIVCGFAFDPHVSEESTRYGNLVVLPTKMNPDLAMGDELLKKTGAGNLFMVFGEPDLNVTTNDDDQLVVELRGLDVYDPTTGEIRSSSTDDIACWFVDTNYNGESFFVRHAYFTGADEPYEKLKRALRAEIDEDAWSQLYSTTSRAFPKPETGKIAVKVINHYGDEVLKVYEV